MASTFTGLSGDLFLIVGGVFLLGVSGKLRVPEAGWGRQDGGEREGKPLPNSLRSLGGGSSPSIFLSGMNRFFTKNLSKV